MTFAAVGVIGLLAASALASWAGADSTRGDFPSYKPITFRRGSIGNARFGPDGRDGDSTPHRGKERPATSTPDVPTALASARWVSRVRNCWAFPPQVRWRFARTRLVWKDSHVAGCSSIVPTAGGALRPIIENVQDIDWSADGKQMAIVRFAPEKDLWRLEFPVGKVLLEGSNWVSAPRISPDGKHIAFYDHGNSGWR